MLIVKKVTEENWVGNHSCKKYQLKNENGTGQLPGLPDITGRSSRLTNGSFEEIVKLPECLKSPLRPLNSRRREYHFTMNGSNYLIYNDIKVWQYADIFENLQ